MLQDNLEPATRPVAGSVLQIDWVCQAVLNS